MINLCGSEGVNPLSNNKNDVAIFSGAVAVGSKRGLMVPGAMRAVTVAVWAVTASTWAVTSSMSEVTAAMYDLQVTCGMLQAPCGLLHLYV